MSLLNLRRSLPRSHSSKIVQEKNSMSVLNVGKRFYRSQNSLRIKNPISKRSPVNAINVERLFSKYLLFLDFRKFILEKNSMNAVNVRKTSQTQISVFIRKVILERHIMNVVFVVRYFYKCPHLRHIRKFIWERDPIYVLNVDRPLPRRHN